MNKNYYNHGNRCKYLLRYHLILVCKYRYNLLVDENVINTIKQLSKYISEKHNVHIDCMETDKNHIHYMIETKPTVNISNYVRTLKSYTTFHIWKYFDNWLSSIFYNEHTFWTDGYFIATIGEVSSQTAIILQIKEKDVNNTMHGFHPTS